MKKADVEKHVESLMAKASQSQCADDALKFSQAANNAASAFAVLRVHPARK